MAKSRIPPRRRDTTINRSKFSTVEQLSTVGELKTQLQNAESLKKALASNDNDTKIVECNRLMSDLLMRVIADFNLNGIEGLDMEPATRPLSTTACRLLNDFRGWIQSEWRLHARS